MYWYSTDERRPCRCTARSDTRTGTAPRRTTAARPFPVEDSAHADGPTRCLRLPGLAHRAVLPPDAPDLPRPGDPGPALRGGPAPTGDRAGPPEDAMR